MLEDIFFDWYKFICESKYYFSNICRMDKNTTNCLTVRMVYLEYKIANWGASNSQSNPGAVMELRAMKKELEKIKKELRL